MDIGAWTEPKLRTRRETATGVRERGTKPSLTDDEFSTANVHGPVWGRRPELIRRATCVSFETSSAKQICLLPHRAIRFLLGLGSHITNDAEVESPSGPFFRDVDSLR